MPKQSENPTAERRRRVTGAMARKPWEEAPPQKPKTRPKPSPLPEPASAPVASRRRRTTGAMAQKPWAEAPKRRAPEPEPEPEPKDAGWEKLPFAEDEAEDVDDYLFAGLEPEGEPLPSTVAQWAQLSLVQQTAAKLLGFAAASWPAPEHLAVVEKMWVELTKEERTAAQVMRYTQELWDAADSDDDDDDDTDVCKLLSLGQWLGQQGLSHTEQVVTKFVERRPGTQLEALRDLLVEELDELVSSMELEDSLEARFRGAVANLRPHSAKADISADPGVAAASHRLRAVDNHAAWFIAEREGAATKLQARWRGRAQRKIGLPQPQPVEWTAERRAKVYYEVGAMSKEEQEALLEKMEAEGEWVVRDRDLRNYLMEQKAMGHLGTKKSKQIQQAREAKRAFEADVDGAATKLQAQWRGYRSRKARKTAAATANAAMWGVMDASGKFRRRRELAIENKRHAAATRVQSTYRGHVARSHLRKRRHEEALRNAISHEDDHKEFGSILYTLERAATVDEPVEKSAHAKAHLAALNSKAVHEEARNIPWLSKEARQAFKNKGRAQQRPQSAGLLGTSSRRTARRSRRERPASAFARPRDVVLNLDRTSDAVTWATMNGIQIPPKLAPLGNSTTEQYTARSQGGFKSNVDETISDGEQLCHAAWSGDVDAVCRLLWNGVDVNSREKSDSTSLLLATAAGKDEVVEVLLGCGADTEHVDSEGRSALQLAAKYGRKKCIELLLVANADVNVASVEDGITPFHLACVSGHSETVSLLLANGADPRAKTHNGMTGGQLLIEKHEREKERKDEVLKLVKEENYPREMSTQSDISLLGDAGRKEAEKMRVKVELAEFRDEFMSVKQDMLGMKRQLAGMIGQINGFGGAITELAERSTQSVAAVVRIAPSGDHGGSLRPHSAAPTPASFMASSAPTTQRGPAQTRPHSAMAALSSMPGLTERTMQADSSMPGNFSGEDSWSITEEWEQSRQPESVTRKTGTGSVGVSRPVRARPATAGPVGMLSIGENSRPQHGMGLERPQLPQRPRSALPYAQSYLAVSTPPQRPASAHRLLGRPSSATSSRPSSSGGDRPGSGGGQSTRPSSGSSMDSRSIPFNELEMRGHEISAISNDSFSQEADDWQSPASAPRDTTERDAAVRTSGAMLLAQAERSAQFNMGIGDPPGSADEGQEVAIDQHGLAAQVLLGAQAAAHRREASRPYSRPLSSVSESSLGQQDDDGDIEFVGTGKTLSEVLALTDRAAIVDPLRHAVSRENTWNQAEMIRLSMAVKLKGENDWEKVANIVSTGAVPRTAADCADAWERNMDQYTTQGQWIGYTSSDRPLPGADAAALEGMVASVKRQLEQNPDNVDLQELLHNMQRMLFESVHIDKAVQQARSEGQAMAVSPSRAQATHDWVEAERIRASFDNGGTVDSATMNKSASTLAQQKHEDPPQTRSELIHAALARDCTHKMGPAEKSVVFASTGGEWYCDGCGEQNPAGRLFQCRVCNEYDLCTQCMRAQGRETEVLFNRLNLGGSMAAGALGGATASKQIRKKESYEEREAEKARLRKAVEELEDMQHAARERRQAERMAAAAARKQAELEQEAARKRRWLS